MLGVRSVYVDVANEIVLVQSTLPSSTVQCHLEQTGKLVVFRGYGSGGEGASVAAPSHHGAAVSIMKWKGVVHGLARLVQVSLTSCTLTELKNMCLKGCQDYFNLCMHVGCLSTGT